MKLSQEAVNELILIICAFDRERGIPHNYMDLETAIKNIELDVQDNTICFTAIPKEMKHAGK